MRIKIKNVIEQMEAADRIRATDEWLKNPHAIALGRLGGSANTAAQNAARARNAKLGGWPKGRPRSLNPKAGPGFGEGRHYQGCGSWTGGKCTCWRINPTIERAKKKGEK